MCTLILKDLDINVDLDKQAAGGIFGGKRRTKDQTAATGRHTEREAAESFSTGNNILTPKNEFEDVGNGTSASFATGFLSGVGLPTS